MYNTDKQKYNLYIKFDLTASVYIAWLKILTLPLACYVLLD